MYALIDDKRVELDVYVAGEGLARLELTEENAPERAKTVEVYDEAGGLLGSHRAEDFQSVSAAGRVLALHDMPVSLEAGA